jgi:hypothetical protein
MRPSSQRIPLPCPSLTCIFAGEHIAHPIRGWTLRSGGCGLSPQGQTIARDGRGAVVRVGSAEDPEDTSRHLAQLLDGLTVTDRRFDTVLCTYSMWSVPDEGGTVLEMKRVLKPGGRFLVDPVRSSVAPIYWIQRLMELAPSRGERELTRRPITHVLAAGFLIEETDRWRAGMIERLVAGKP